MGPSISQLDQKTSRNIIIMNTKETITLPQSKKHMNLNDSNIKNNILKFNSPFYLKKELGAIEWSTPINPSWILTREIKAQKNESIKINKSFNLKDLIIVASARITHTSSETKNSTIVSLDKKVSPSILIKRQRTMIKSISEVYGERKQFI